MVKTLKKLYNWIIGKVMPFRPNQQAINNWIVWLNRAYPVQNGQWVAIDGFNTATGIDYNTMTGQPVFNGNRGYPLKGFVNTASGEVKWFDARRFYIIS